MSSWREDVRRKLEKLSDEALMLRYKTISDAQVYAFNLEHDDLVGQLNALAFEIKQEINRR